MDFKIALGNVKKSFKDYGIYFLTLVLSVCIFYTFNSIGSQKAFLEINESGKIYVETLNSFMGYISVFVVVILGTLILYANKFLINKRNKEFGIYRILGMGKFQISKILIFETAVVGLFSLVCGILIGIVLSQGISLISLNLFNIDVEKYKFVLSLSSLGNTIMYFVMIFLIVMILNVYVISKYKIIDFLVSNKKNEKIKFKNPFVHIILFVIGVIFLIKAYGLILEIGLVSFDDIRFFISIALGVIGTILFFLSVSSFLIYVFKKIKRIYFKNLNIFVVKQLGSKINTNFLSMGIICLMFFMTIGILSSGLSFRDVITSGIEEATPFDASAYMYYSIQDNMDLTVEESFEKLGFKFNPGDKFVSYNEYEMDVLIKDIFDIDDIDLDSRVIFVKISDYNKILNLMGKREVELNKDEVLLLSNFSKLIPIIEQYMKENDTILINNIEYKIKNENLIEMNLMTVSFKNNILTIVMDDKYLDENGLVSSNNLNVNFNENTKEESEKNFVKLLASYRKSNFDYNEFGYVLGLTRNQVYEKNNGLTIVILFVGIYLGIIFLISSMAVLALQQLVGVNETINNYRALKKLGASIKEINSTIFKQVCVYFSLPLGLALVHSIVGIKVVSDFLQVYNKPNIFVPSLITMGVLLIVYLLYFYVTYTTYKNVVKNEI